MGPTGGNEMRVVWTRGNGCAELAQLLTEGSPGRISGDLVEECINQRADLLVSRRLPGGFDLVNVAVPLGFVPENVSRVASAVAGGPHSLLAAETASRIALRLGVEAEMISAVRPEADPEDAEELLEHLGLALPDMEGRVVPVEGISELVEQLEEGTLVVLGAPGGSWLQRSRFGPGARLVSKARAGAIVVRSAPDRVFRWMGDPVFVSPLRNANDTLRLHPERLLAVADEGMLIGLVRRESLESARDSAVGSLMEEAMSAKVDETIAEAMELEPTFGPDPIPVTDHAEHLVGGLLLPAH